jgi:uncharacterized protein (TIGR02147 family)
MQPFFEYLDYRILLKELLAEQKKKEPWFSYRMFSKHIGISSSGFLSLVLSGKRNISQDLAIKICSKLKLSKSECTYFLALVRYTQASSAKEKEYAFEELLLFKRERVVSLSGDQREFYNQWYYSALRELVAVTNVTDNNFKAIAERLTPKIKVSEVKESIELLLRLDLIKKDENGIYRRTNALITSSNTTIPPSYFHRFQSEMINLASNALHFIPKDERDISTVTLSTNQNRMDLIKKRIEQCRREIMVIAKQSNYPDRILQLNIQFFPLCNPKDSNT